MDNEVKNESVYFDKSDIFPRPSVDGAESFDREQKKRTRLIIRITVLVIVGSLLLCELLGLRFVERLAICDMRCACDHWSESHTHFTEFDPCVGLKIKTDDYDFFFSYDKDENGDPCVAYLVRGVKRFGLMYYEKHCDSWELLYDDNGEPAFNLIVFRGRKKNYYFIENLWKNVNFFYNGWWESWREYPHRCERITVNGEPVDLYLMSYFEYEGELDCIVLEDGTTVHPKTCRREEPLYNLPQEILTMPNTEPSD